jgi:Ni,Fe-hydrogenase maturation factor
MKALIIGLGNDYRSDDGVGRVVARRLRAELLDEVGILEDTARHWSRPGGALTA